MLRFLYLFLQVDIVLRNFPLFVILGGVVSIVFPILYPPDGRLERLQTLTDECTAQRFSNRKVGTTRDEIQECYEFAKAQVKNDDQVKK